MRSSPYQLRSSTSTTHYRSSTPRNSAKMARDKFHRFLGTPRSPLTSGIVESDVESEASSAENVTPNHSITGNRSLRKSARLTIHSDEDETARNSDDHQSNVSGTHSPARNQDIFALQRSHASRHFERPSDRGRTHTEDEQQHSNRRHSNRLTKRSFENRRPFYLDELEASEEEIEYHSDHHADGEAEYEERSLTAFQRYNLRDRKRTVHHAPHRPSMSQRRHRPPSRYNLRPHRGTRLSNDYQVPWSVADQFVFAKQPKRQMIPDKALMEATPELQPYEADLVSGQHDENTSTIANDEEIMAQTIQPSTANEPPFARIAGMQDYVKQLKEMVVFPLLYPSFFNRLGIAPPRGVLFYGPPGTGKTLMARLLAESCSTNSKKVSFFMRNGSDCLSKWIGEAERNMKLLFQKAKECQPSIIFFDEIDGLAPERSARADQSHISLVSTLLALMDGLDDRGNVVVIGATNRIHALDPALRRPGRFDREFYFGLPDEATRNDILKIQTKSWDPLPSEEVLKKLAHITHGFSGADLKGLCTEAALYAIRRVAPEAYENTAAPSEAHFADRQITVLNDDFYNAFRKIVPSTRRYDESERPFIPLPFSFLVAKCMSVIADRIEDTIGQPIPCVEPSLYGNSTWNLQRNLLNFDSPFSASMTMRMFQMVTAKIDRFKVLTVNVNKLTDDAPISSQLYNGVLKEAKALAPSIVLVPDLSHFSRTKELYDTIDSFCDSLLPCEPILVINTHIEGEDAINLPMIPPKDLSSFTEYVLAKEVKSIVIEKLSKLEVISAYGQSIGVDLANLLVSPFPDYQVFIESLAIFPNHDDIIGAVQQLLPLGTEEWYKAMIPNVMERFDEEEVMEAVVEARINIIRRVQGVKIPTVETVRGAITQQNKIV